MFLHFFILVGGILWYSSLNGVISSSFISQLPQVNHKQMLIFHYKVSSWLLLLFSPWLYALEIQALKKFFNWLSSPSGRFSSRLLLGEFPATILSTFLGDWEVTKEGTTLLASTWAIFILFFIFRALQDKFHKTAGILLDPGFKIWICWITAMSLQCWFSGRSSITTFTHL